MIQKPVVIHIKAVSQAQLPHIVQTLDRLRPGFDSGQCGQQHGREDDDDRNNHEKFDEREGINAAAFIVAHPYLGEKPSLPRDKIAGVGRSLCRCDSESSD